MGGVFTWVNMVHAKCLVGFKGEEARSKKPPPRLCVSTLVLQPIDWYIIISYNREYVHLTIYSSLAIGQQFNDRHSSRCWRQLWTESRPLFLWDLVSNEQGWRQTGRCELFVERRGEQSEMRRVLQDTEAWVWGPLLEKGGQLRLSEQWHWRQEPNSGRSIPLRGTGKHRVFQGSQ